MAPPSPAARRRSGRLLPVAACAAALLPLLAGCANQDGLDSPLLTILYVAVGLETAPDLATELEQQKQMRQRLQRLQASFQDVRPGVHLELMIFSSDDVVREVQRRTRSGLAPDLMLVDGATAEHLHRRQLTRPVSLRDPAMALLRPELIPYVLVDSREAFAVPVGLQPQLACFDRRRMGASPPTLAALLQASSRGSSFGFNLDVASLSWTMGSLGALSSIAAVSRGGPVQPEQLGAIRTWLGWLRNADLQQHIQLEPSTGELLEGLRSGRFDWIPCHSRDASLLRLSLGSHLGLAALPSGPGGPATPISTVRVWAFGRNSSPLQRQAAQDLVRFTLNPPVQRAFTIQTQGLLPVSRAATLPVASSANLSALIAAQTQAREAENLTGPLISLRRERRELNRTMTRFLYGELNPHEGAEALVAGLRQRQPPPSP